MFATWFRILNAAASVALVMWVACSDTAPALRALVGVGVVSVAVALRLRRRRAEVTDP